MGTGRMLRFVIFVRIMSSNFTENCDTRVEEKTCELANLWLQLSISNQGTMAFLIILPSFVQILSAKCILLLLCPKYFTKTKKKQRH